MYRLYSRGFLIMSQLPVSINGKVFNINCPDEEKEKVLSLAQYVNDKINLVAPKCKTMSEVSLLSFTLLAIADDIVSKNNKIEALEKSLAEAEEAQQNNMTSASPPIEMIQPSSSVDDNAHISDDVYAKIQMAIQDIKSITHDLENVENNIS